VRIHTIYSMKTMLTPIKFVEKRKSGIKKVRWLSYWLYRCECGKEKIIEKRSVDINKTLSCGCLHKKNISKLPSGESSFNRLFGSYELSCAKKRNFEFSLTREEFRSLVVSNCHYCNEPPLRITKIKNTNGDFIYNGIDRLDNLLGYTVLNCVSCCRTCNIAKLDMTEELFYSWISKVYLNLKSKNKI